MNNDEECVGPICCSQSPKSDCDLTPDPVVDAEDIVAEAFSRRIGAAVATYLTELAPLHEYADITKLAREFQFLLFTRPQDLGDDDGEAPVGVPA